MADAVRTQVAIVGAGPAGLLLSHLLEREGIDSVVLETRSRAYVEARIRAGILEHSTVSLLDEVGLGARLHREGFEHRGIYLQWPHERHHLDFVDLVGRGVTVYGQTEITKDLGKARDAAGQRFRYETTDTQLHDLLGEHPSVTYVDAEGRPGRVDAEVVVGCDGSFGPSRAAVPASAATTWERTYPYSWLGVLADVDAVDRRAHLRLAPRRLRAALDAVLHGLPLLPAGAHGHRLEDWSDDRIWAALADRSVTGRTAGSSTGPITDKSVLPMRSLRPAADAARPAVPRRGRRAHRAAHRREGPQPRRRRRRPARARARRLLRGRPTLADAYSDTALRRVWRCTHFSWWMTTMLHTGGDPFDASSSSSSCAGSPRPRVPPGSPRTTPACRSDTERPLGRAGILKQADGEGVTVPELVTSDGVRLRRAMTGPARPVVLVAGYTAPAASWAFQVDALVGAGLPGGSPSTALPRTLRGAVVRPAHGAARQGPARCPPAARPQSVVLVGGSMGASAIWAYTDLFGTDGVPRHRQHRPDPRR
jgi:p-hydroxybenzoate 3-monooxygenase